MTETLTESFCERCGTRYTFETAAPRRRSLGALGTIGRGLKQWVVQTDSSFDEAMASARSEDEQRVTNAQLEAFHRTFNFCLSCRQYTCTDCWNAVEGRCLTCSPLPEAEVARTLAAAPVLEAPRIVFPVGVGAIEEAETDAAIETRLAELFGGTAEPIAQPAGMEGEPEPEPAVAEAEPIAEPAVAEAEPIAEAEPEPVAAVAEAMPVEAQVEPIQVEAELVEAKVEPMPAEAGLDEAEPVQAEAEAEPVELEAAPGVEAPPTAAPPGPSKPAFPGFRPGRSLDDEIAAYELRVAALAAAPPEPLPPVVIEATRPPAPILVRPSPPVEDRIAAFAPSAPAPIPTAAAPGTCRACGLSISASARFCRRCGTAQQVA